MTKLSKTETNYGNGMVHSHCGKVFVNDNGYCKHYRDSKDKTRYSLSQSSPVGSCEIVDGDIKPTAWCDQFSRAKK